MEARFDSAQRDLYTHKKDAMTRSVLKTIPDYLNAQVAESQTCKQLFSLTNTLLCKSKLSPLPTIIPAAHLPHSFCEFFTEKIKDARQNLDNTHSPHVPTVVPNVAAPLVQFSFHQHQKEVHNILKDTAQKT